MEHKFNIYFMALGPHLSNEFRASIIFTEGNKTIKSFNKAWEKAQVKATKNVHKVCPPFQSRERKENILQETIRLLVKQGYDVKFNDKTGGCIYI